MEDLHGSVVHDCILEKMPAAGLDLRPILPWLFGYHHASLEEILGRLVSRGSHRDTCKH